MLALGTMEAWHQDDHVTTAYSAFQTRVSIKDVAATRVQRRVKIIENVTLAITVRQVRNRQELASAKS